MISVLSQQYEPQVHAYCRYYTCLYSISLQLFALNSLSDVPLRGGVEGGQLEIVLKAHGVDYLPEGLELHILLPDVLLVHLQKEEHTCKAHRICCVL